VKILFARRRSWSIILVHPRHTKTAKPQTEKDFSENPAALKFFSQCRQRSATAKKADFTQPVNFENSLI